MAKKKVIKRKLKKGNKVKKWRNKKIILLYIFGNLK